jgi:hypothetical protein
MLKQTVFLQPEQRSFCQILLLFPRDGFSGMPEFIRLSSLYLNKDNGVTVLADEVEFSPLSGKLTSQNPHPLLSAQKSPGSALATISKQLSQHAGQVKESLMDNPAVQALPDRIRSS